MLTDFNPNVDFKIFHVNVKGKKLNSLKMVKLMRLVYKDSKLVLNNQLELSISHHYP